MKTIICDFKRSSLGVIGEENEHNAIELLFNLPKDFEAADYIHVEFDTMNGEPFARDTFEFNKEEMTLRGRLDQKVMKAGELKIQLVGYAIDEEGTIDEIAKSPVIKAIIGDSVNGIIREGDENPSMIELLKAKLDKLLEEGINTEGGGGIDTVNTVNDLPADAEQDDIAFVKEAAFVETVEYQEEVPIVLTGGEQIFNVEFKQDAKFIHETNIGELCPEVNNKENIISYECGMATPNGECIVSCVYYPPSLVSGFIGVEQSIDAYMVMQYNDDDSMTQYYKFRGMSAKDFITNMLDFPGTEEQIQVLLGEHYADKSEDNPSYNWIKVIMSGESLNDNSVFLEDAGAYFTLEYDTTVDIKGLLLFDSYGFGVMKILEDGETEDLFSISGSIAYPEDNDEEDDFNEILKYGNAIANIFLSGGIREASYDIYKQKGFHIYEDGKWTSLEEKMNIPKIVKTYSELPKSFIENGLMVVANEEKKLPEPTSEISSGAQGLIAIKPTFSVAEEMERVKQLAIENGAPEDLDWDSGDSGFEVSFYDPISGYSSWFGSGYIFNNDIKGIAFEKPTNKEDIFERWYYADEPGAEIGLPYNRDTGSYETFITTEGGCWYYYTMEDGDKNTYLITPPQKYKGTEPFFISNTNYMCAGTWVGFYSDDFEFDIEPNSYTFGFIDFYDSSKVENYPKGFYQYSNNRWYHQPDIAGASFDNEDVLKKITSEDIGNIDLNSEARHEHYNKSVLDQLPWDSYDRLANQVPANTNARHTHNNQSLLNQITDSNYIHQHSNKSELDNITSTTISNIAANTSARHTHSNKTYLDKITYDITTIITANTNARHDHYNKTTLDNITSTTINNINNNTNARHTHSNKTILDKITQAHLDNSHTHSNKTVLDKVTQTHLDNSHTHGNKEILDNLKEFVDKSHSHENQEILDKFLIKDNEFIVDGRKMRKSFEQVYVDKNTEKSYEITPQENTLYDLPDDALTLKIMLTEDGSYYRKNCMLGEFWFHLANWEKFKNLRFEFHTNGEPIYFTNNMPDDDIQGYFILKMQRMFYGYTVTWYSTENTFRGGNGTIYDEKISINPQGTEYKYNYGRFTENGFEFAPAYLEYNNVWYVNADDIYEEAGYQRVYGNTKPLRSLPENTHEEMKVHNINDLIIIERNYVPNEVCSGYYVNSGFITDFFYYFAGYSQEDLYLGLLNGIDLSNAEEVSFMFADCEVKSIPSLDLRSAKTTYGIFFTCDAEIIENLIIGQMDGKTFTELGMNTMLNLKNINIDGRIKVNSDLSLLMPNSLTIEAWVKIFEAFEDNSNEDTQYVCYINQTVLQELTPEQISIVTSKNILLA